MPSDGAEMNLTKVILFFFTLAILLCPPLRAVFGSAIVAIVRPFALTVGWLFVAAIYIPIYIYNVVFPFVPYDTTPTGTPNPNQPVRPPLRKYHVSQEDFNKKFPPVFKEDSDDDAEELKEKDGDAAQPQKDSSGSEWEKV